MRKIKSVTVISGGDNVSTYTVGDMLNGLKIIEIKNLTNEYEDHIHNEYVGYDRNDSPIFGIVNCPVIIHWYEEK